MSHHENGREISRSDLESMQGQEAAEDAKQPAAENKDATLPPPPGSAPRKKPAELVTDAVQELHEAEDDETVEQGKKVVMALGGSRPRPTTCTKMKTGTMHRCQNEEAWTSVEQETIELDSPEEWAELFRSDGNRGAVPGTAKQQQVHRNVQFLIKKPETTHCEMHKKTQFSPMKMKFAPSRGGFTKISRRGSKQAMTCKQTTREESKKKTHERVNEKAAPAKDRAHQHWHQQPKPADQHLGPAQQPPAKHQHPGPAPGTKKMDTTAESKKHVHNSLKSPTKVNEKCAMHEQDSCNNLSYLQELKAGRTLENLRRPNSTQPTTTFGTRSMLHVLIAKCNVNCLKKDPFCLPQDVANCPSMTVRQIRGRLEHIFSSGGGKTNNNGNGGNEKMEWNWGWGDMKSSPACTRARDDVSSATSTPKDGTGTGPLNTRECSS
eukprot:jgi/Bigna1/137245/aug1.38_g11953